MYAQRSWAKQFTYDLSRVAVRLAGVVVCQIRCEGRQNIPAQGGGLVCSNHQSYLDPVLVGLACDRRLNYLARQTLFHFAPFRWLIQWYDAIPIERDGLGLSGMKETLRRLKRGELVLIFPEGTRSQDGTIGQLKPGFTALARRSSVPLIPVAVVGAYQFWPRSQRWPRPASIWIEFGPPISADEIARLSDDELLERLRQALLTCQAAARYHRHDAQHAPRASKVVGPSREMTSKGCPGHRLQASDQDQPSNRAATP
jgi:1-acyl-sn-glycerol-3-phosphate acyltransferase